MTAAQRGGVLLRRGPEADGGGSLVFVPAAVALRVAALGALTPVAGLRPPALGIALADDEVVTVLALDHHEGPTAASGGAGAAPPSPERAASSIPGAHHAVLCDAGGERVAVVGGTIVATGLFDVEADGVFWQGQRVPTFDVGALRARAEAAIWRERASAGPSRGRA